MKELKYSRLWLFLALFYIILTFYLSLRKFEPSGDSIPFLDKFAHLACYIVLAYGLQQIFEERKYLMIIAFCMVMGVLIEFLQLWTGYRSFEYGDMVADLLGAIIGIIVSKFLLINTLKVIDAKLARILNKTSEN